MATDIRQRGRRPPNDDRDDEVAAEELRQKSEAQGADAIRIARKIERVKNEFRAQYKVVRHLVAQVTRLGEHISDRGEGGRSESQLSRVLDTLTTTPILHRSSHAPLLPSDCTVWAEAIVRDCCVGAGSETAPVQDDHKDNVSDVQTLYDYVDADAIASLKNQLNQEYAVWRTAKREFDQLTTQMDLDVAAVQFVFDEDEENSKQCGDAKQTSERVEAALKAQEIAIQMMICTKRDVAKSLVGKATKSPLIVDELQAHSLKISKYSAEIEDIASTQSKEYHDFVQAFAVLDKLGPQLRTTLQRARILVERCKQSQDVIEGIEIEFDNLSKWYQQFRTAYCKLYDEIERRNEHSLKLQGVIDTFRDKMTQMSNEEAQKRQEFLELHGRYLPPNLYPPIYEPAPLPRIVPEYVAPPLLQMLKRPIDS